MPNTSQPPSEMVPKQAPLKRRWGAGKTTLNTRPWCMLADQTPAWLRVWMHWMQSRFQQSTSFQHRDWHKQTEAVVRTSLASRASCQRSFLTPFASTALRGEKMLTMPELVLQQIECSPTGWCWKASVFKILTVKEVWIHHIPMQNVFNLQFNVVYFCYM